MPFVANTASLTVTSDVDTFKVFGDNFPTDFSARLMDARTNSASYPQWNGTG